MAFQASLGAGGICVWRALVGVVPEGVGGRGQVAIDPDRLRLLRLEELDEPNAGTA